MGRSKLPYIISVLNMRIATLLILLSSLCILSCAKKPAYIYVDDNGIIKATDEAVVGIEYELDGSKYLVVNNEMLRDIVYKLRQYRSAKGADDLLEIINTTWDVSNWGLSNVVDPLVYLYLDKVVTTYVTDMRGMFNGARSFNQPIGNWDVSNVTDMSEMFAKARDFNQDIGNWDVSRVTDMGSMFSGADRFNQNLSNWDVSNVTDMSSMFKGLWFESVTSFNQPIGNWDVSSVTNMNAMFYGATSFNQPIGNWDVSKVTNMEMMFTGANSFNQPIGNWDVSNVTDMSSMFNGATSFNQPIGTWDVSNVTDMGSMFSGADFNQDIGNWDVSSVYYCRNFFEPDYDFNSKSFWVGTPFYGRDWLPNYELLGHEEQIDVHNNIIGIFGSYRNYLYAQNPSLPKFKCNPH